MVPDYYAMLGVEPGADRASIEAALARCQPAWSSGTRNPKNKHTFQSRLDQIPAMRQALLGTPEARGAYDAELAAAMRQERDRKLDALQKLVRLRAAKGGLTVADRTLLREQAVAIGLTHADLDRLAEPIPPKAEAPAEEDLPDPPADVLDPAMRRQIRVTLEHLRRRDLYDALGLTRDAPASEIAAKADAERRRWMQKAQVTAEKTAWLELVSHAQSHLTTAAARGRYDRTLLAEAEDELGESIAFALRGLSRLDAGTRSALLDEAAALGITADRVDRLIARACRSLGVSRDAGPSAPVATSGPPRLLRCRNCAGVTDFGIVSRATKPECKHCRAPLRWDCPICHKSRWVDEPRCLCGFALEQVEPLVRRFEAAQQAFRARDLDAAQAHLERIQDFAPKHVGTRKALEKVRQHREELDRARAAWESARASGHWVAAGKAIEGWERLVPPDHPEVRAARDETRRVLREARAAVARGRAVVATDPKAARGFFRQGLAQVADLAEALDELRRCPPDHPTDLVAEFEAGRVRLRWAPPAPDGLGPVSFVVVRKAGGPVLHLADGSRIAEVSATEYEDRDVVAGETVGYAVVSKRGAVESIAATSATPLLLLASVADVRVEAGDREVSIAWTVPEQAADVWVVRKVGSAPTGPPDGDRVEALRDRLHDRGLENDRVYHYGLFATYATAEGPRRAARGVFVSAQPHPPTQILAAPTLSQDPDGRVRLDWIEPSRGMVRILRTPSPLPHTPGHRLRASEAEGLGGHWLEANGPERAYDAEPPASGLCHYTPLLATAGMLTVGHGVVYSCVPDPSDLRANRIGHGRVLMRWRWSPQGTQSWIIARAGAPPIGPHDPKALRTVVHEAEYSRLGHYTLNLPLHQEGPWHIRVYSTAQVAGETLTSPGLDLTARIVVPGPHPEVTVSYDFRRPSFPGRPWSLTFRTEPAGAEIPPTALVTHPRTVPLSVDDGQIVAQFPAARDGSTFPIQSKVDFTRHRARIFADPHVQPDSLPPIRLRHPENGTTRV